MPSCCRTCDHREHAMHTIPSTPSLVDVCLIVLSFKSPVTATNTRISSALNTTLNNITDAAESLSHPTAFTSWSACLTNPRSVVILTTASETCSSPTSPVFESIMRYLTCPPSVQHVFLDYSVLSLAASSEQTIACDVIILQAPNPSIAGAIGKRFGWDPKRSSLSAQMQSCASVAFSRPGDLTRDFWAWAELHGDPTSPASSSSVGSFGYENGGGFLSTVEQQHQQQRPGLMSLNSDEKNMSLFFAEDEDSERRNMEDETLVMIFQWNSRADADRFKHPLQKSYGQNGEEVRGDLWDSEVAHPVRHFVGVGANSASYKLELKGVEPRIGSRETMASLSSTTGRERSGSKRLSIMASGLGERVSGFWK